jgi:RNA polymerase sigma-70 factor, ECF subfamily
MQEAEPNSFNETHPRAPALTIVSTAPQLVRSRPRSEPPPTLRVAPLRRADYDRPALQPRFEFDAQYVNRLTAGDPEIEDHFTRYFGDLLTLKLRSRLRSPALVEDAKQETFVRVLTTLRKKAGLTNPQGLGSFVNSVCNNVLFEMYRSQSKVTPLEDDHDPAEERATVEANLAREEEDSRVRTIIASLPEREQNLLRWLFLEERPKDEICERLNIDRSYLRVLVHRAKNRFRTEFTQSELEGV